MTTQSSIPFMTSTGWKNCQCKTIVIIKLKKAEERPTAEVVVNRGYVNIFYIQSPAPLHDARNCLER